MKNQVVCNLAGSVTQHCEVQTWKCTCKVKSYHHNAKIATFYGDKCHDRNCTLSLWSKFSPCSETCGYGGQTSREQTKEKKPCFVSCCNDDFNCNKAENKKCISSSLKCNYENDCDDNQDEEDDACEEKCKWKYSDLKNDKKAIISINKTQKTSKLQYKFRCCKLNK